MGERDICIGIVRGVEGSDLISHGNDEGVDCGAVSPLQEHQVSINASICKVMMFPEMVHCNSLPVLVIPAEKVPVLVGLHEFVDMARRKLK